MRAPVSTQADLFGPGLRGILFVASATNFSDASVEDGPTDHIAERSGKMSQTASGLSDHVHVKGETLRQWQSVRAVAKEKDVPCLLFLSKCDLLSEMPLPSGLGPSQVEQMLRSQFFVPTSVSKGNDRSSGPELLNLFAAKVTADEINATKSSMQTPDADSRAVNLLGDTSEFGMESASRLLMSRTFPELEGEADIEGLEQVYCNQSSDLHTLVAAHRFLRLHVLCGRPSICALAASVHLTGRC